MVAVIFNEHLVQLMGELIHVPFPRIQPGYVWQMERDGLVGKRVFNDGSILEFVINLTDDGNYHGEFRSIGVDLSNLHPDLRVMEMGSNRGAGGIRSWLLDAEGSNFRHLSGFNS